MVAFKQLWRGHPINHSVMTPCLAPDTIKNLEGKTIHKGLPVYANQCAIRMSVALKAAGVTADQLPGCAHCGAHPRSEMHFIRANQLATTIAGANLPGVGKREVISGADVAKYYPELFGRTGIIFIKDYWRRSGETNPTGDHIDVWNGYRSSAKWLMEWFFWLGYYSNYAGAKEMWFWEVK